jgi:hypothetical protein
VADLLETLTRELGGSSLDQISRSLGADRSATGDAMAAALPALIGALSRNASQGDGARALSEALARDHDGSILDDLGGFLGKGETGAGDAILRHVLGERRSRVEAGLSGAAGIDAGSVSKLLAMLAPVVLGALGRTQRQRGVDADGLASMLRNERRDIEHAAPAEMGILDRLLDTDDDGDVDLGDVARTGFSALSKWLGSR